MTHPTAAKLASAIGVVPARAGAFRPGQGAFVRGLKLHEACRDWSWFDLALLALTGRRFAPAEVSLLQTLCTFTSYPDARIWNNRVAALAGSARAPAALALGAAVAVSDAYLYGGGPILEIYDFLAANAHRDDPSLAEAVHARLRSGRRLAGYGRPITADDERIAPFLEAAATLGLDGGVHLTATQRIGRILDEAQSHLKLNYGAIVAAVCLDLDLDRQSCEAFTATLFLGGMPAVWRDAAQDRPAGGLLPIPSDMLVYDGPPARRWPVP